MVSVGFFVVNRGSQVKHSCYDSVMQSIVKVKYCRVAYSTTI